MDEQKYPRIISDRKFDEWIKGCPLQIKEIIIKKKSEKSDGATLPPELCGVKIGRAHV